MTGRSVRVVPIGPPLPDPELLGWLVSALSERLGVRARSDPAMAIQDAWRNAVGRQTSSNEVTDALIERHPPVGDVAPDEWVLGVTAADLFAPSREFVFGEAAQGGSWAVVSTARLVHDDPERLRRRLLTEVVHELGHLAGLDHCPRASCAMAPSTDPEGIDRKEADFCATCASLLRDRESALDRRPRRG